MVRGGTLGAGPAGRLAVRRAMHAVSSLGCGAAMAALAAGTAQGGGMAPAAAAACLVAAVGCYGFSFGGFHAYVQVGGRGGGGAGKACPRPSVQPMWGSLIRYASGS